MYNIDYAFTRRAWESLSLGIPWSKVDVEFSAEGGKENISIKSSCAMCLYCMSKLKETGYFFDDGLYCLKNNTVVELDDESTPCRQYRSKLDMLSGTYALLKEGKI